MAILILLQGFNPLPNYVVAKYILGHDLDLLGEHVDEIVIFYSKQTRHNISSTKGYAENLEKLLQSAGVPMVLMPLTNINHGQTIHNEVQESLQRRIVERGLVHLNYTGGTKATGIHSYMTIQAMCEDSHANFTASYLDDRHHMLYWDDNGRRIPLVNEVSLSITDFLSLHSYKPISTKGETLHESRDNMHNTEALLSYMQSLWQNDPEKYRGLQSAIKTLYFVHDKYVTSVCQLQKNFDALHPQLTAIWSRLEPVEPYLLTLQKLKESSRRNELSKSLIQRDKATVDYIRGLWLEDYVRQQIQNAAINEMSLTPEVFGQSLKAKRDSEKEFELDLYLIRGYQLIGISVTTDTTESLCKSKGFEIIHRTRQIGGDGRVALLVTLLSDEKRDRIQEELKSDTDISERFRVFGESDLTNIGPKIIGVLNNYE